ncbi:hypothetical protein Tco_0396893 [Tanacetum coccineum]
METRFRDIERRMMTALEMVNMRVSYQVDVRSRESFEFYTRHHDAQKDRAAVRAEIEVRRRQRAMSDLLETDRRRREEMRELRAADRTRQQQIIQTLTVMQTLQREMVPLQGLVTTLQGHVTALQGQVMTIQGQKMAPKRATRSARATTTPAPTATTTTNVTNAQLQAMIDQGVSAALAARDATRNGTDSHSSGTGIKGI